MESKDFFISTFGCRANQADSAALRKSLREAGYREVSEEEEADLVIVNSCTVTHKSDQQVRQFTRRMRRKNPHAKIVLTGCYAQRDPGYLSKNGLADLVVGNCRKQELVDILNRSPEKSSNEETCRVVWEELSSERSFDLIAGDPGKNQTRPQLKIQDGCSASCSYCIVPSVRGPSRSVPPQQVLDGLRKYIDEGFREIVLTGIHLGIYGMNLLPRTSLDQLLAEIINLPGLGQVRISSIEPMDLSRRVIDLAADSEKIAPHFHICLQSGSDRVLSEMRRPYKAAEFAELVEYVRKRIPLAGIGTDVIAGFPGETEEEHQETVRFIKGSPFTYLHVFPYSDRSGTPASVMDNKVSPEICSSRSRELRQVSSDLQDSFRKSMTGRNLRVLTLTSEVKGKRRALTSNYLDALLPREIPGNELVNARVLKESGGYLVCEV
ncbi:MAG: tRNA (N(6)-L-threonylcarbamoyladenosine(37)-C(2))-methylthiotransferase MtaB [Anaerolineales bacterium]|nr:tRNA (N(6)-L-threonylcarbamoyladenosine(37)-C(2))-methylthiotransferase MtaB [Anaerolineales bacterium]